MVRRWLTQRPASGRSPTKRSSSHGERGGQGEASIQVRRGGGKREKGKGEFPSSLHGMYANHSAEATGNAPGPGADVGRRGERGAPHRRHRDARLHARPSASASLVGTMSPLGSVSGCVCQSLGFTTPEVRGGLRRAARDDPEPAGHGLLREGWREARREQGHRHRTVGRRHPAQGDDRGARDRLSRVGFRGRGGRGREPSSHRPRSRSTTPIVPATAAPAVTPSSRTNPLHAEGEAVRADPPPGGRPGA